MKKLYNNSMRSGLSVRQKIVLKFTIVFFLGLVVLTFFSAQIMENNLAGVYVFYAASGYVGEQVYETVIINDCLRIDTEGTYVWIVIEKDTPLGKRCYAKRFAVEVVGIDNDKYAIRPSLDWSTAIVEESEGDLHEGEQVKILR